VVQKKEKNFYKISITERMGGLFKRNLATLAREYDLPWWEVLDEATDIWNDTYVSKLGLRAPSEYSEENFDELLKRLYDLDPMEEHSMYPVGRSFTEKQLRSIFKFKPGDPVYVSMKTINKRIRGPVRSARPIYQLAFDLSACYVVFYSSLSITPSSGPRAGTLVRCWHDASAFRGRREARSRSTWSSSSTGRRSTPCTRRN
jgi:hypothetical protein